MSVMTDTMNAARETELTLLANGVVSPMTMPLCRPKHTWRPPAGTRRPVSAPAPAPATDNHHIRRVRQRSSSGWHA